MGRMIDPSELEGDELANWYRRSPADVEAEREAARQDQYDAFVKSIGGRPEPQADADGSGNGATGFMQARFPLPTAAPPPSGPMVGPTLDSWGAAPIGAAKSGFFGAHDYSPALGGYYTDLPSPLNTVRSNGTHWWELGDGSLAQTGEVERIYAEQQRRLKGRDGVEPAARVRTIDKGKDGEVPLASQVGQGERELDPTCAPNGGWERDPGFPNYPEQTKRYETQITRAPGLDYVIRNPGQRPVKFDGCAVWDPQHPLLEAKGPGYAALLPKAQRWGFFEKMRDKTADQSKRQADAARHHRIDWHVAEPDALQFFQDATKGTKPPIVPRLTLPSW